MKNFVNSAPCFSGECGLCVNCCGNYQSSPVLSEETSKTQRAQDHIKFEKPQLEEMTQTYWKDLRKIYQEVAYSSPEEPGGLPRMYHIKNEPFTSDIDTYETYPLHRRNHDMVCHMPLCRMMYQNTHEYQRKVYNVLPIYVGKHCNLCAPCVRSLGVEVISRL
jgi:hypothetical protein